VWVLRGYLKGVINIKRYPILQGVNVFNLFKNNNYKVNVTQTDRKPERQLDGQTTRRTNRQTISFFLKKYV